MCQSIYISSDQEIPEIKWNEEAPGFYLTKVDEGAAYAYLKSTLKQPFIYKACSFMGCACGFAFGSWSLENHEENHVQRCQDVADLFNYLSKHKTNNKLLLFATMWDDFPAHFESKNFHCDKIPDDEFEFEELVIHNIV